MPMKHTAESLQAQGYRGFQRNTITGHTVEARYPLDYLAYALTHRPYRLRYTHDDIGMRVRVHIENDYWVPPTCLEVFAERPMTQEEREAAAQRLERKGIRVTL